MNVYEAIRIRALRDVVKSDDVDYAMRKVFRWYSKTFHTPLHEVETLPTDFVLQTYWESQYEDMEEPTIDGEIKDLTKTDAEKKAEDRAWDEQQAEEVEFAKQVGGQQPSKIADLKPEITKSMVTDTPNAPTSIAKVEDSLGKLAEVLDNMKELPPDVHMSFVTPEDIEGLMDEDSIQAPKKPGKQ